MHGHLLYDVHLVAFTPPTLTLRLSKKAPKNLPQQLFDLLKMKTEQVWTIAISEEIGHPTLHEKAQQALEERRKVILEAPLVTALIEAFPGTTLVEFKDS